MAAKDYVFVTGMTAAYLTKKTKGPAMSQDSRMVMDNEIICLFEFYLRNWCETNKQDKIDPIAGLVNCTYLFDLANGNIQQ